MLLGLVWSKSIFKFPPNSSPSVLSFLVCLQMKAYRRSMFEGPCPSFVKMNKQALRKTTICLIWGQFLSSISSQQIQLFVNWNKNHCLLHPTGCFDDIISTSSSVRSATKILDQTWKLRIADFFFKLGSMTTLEVKIIKLFYLSLLIYTATNFLFCHEHFFLLSVIWSMANKWISPLRTLQLSQVVHLKNQPTKKNLTADISNI